MTNVHASKFNTSTAKGNIQTIRHYTLQSAHIQKKFSAIRINIDDLIFVKAKALVL